MAKEIKHLDEQGIRLLIRLISSLQNETSNLADKCILPYDDSKTYQTSDICYKDGSLWYCKAISNGNPPVYGDSHWEVIDGYENEIDSAYIEQLMSEVTPEQWTKLQEVISEEISTNKVWSSSKSYTENQNILQQAKNYTLEEIAKSTTGSYVIANSSDDVLDDKHLYLISNASGNFDIYALVSGSPVKIGDTTVNIDNLLDTTTAENTYLKQSDATSTYSTITTTDGLRTDLDDHMNDTVAHMTQSEKDKLLTSDDITTTLSITSTNDEIVGAKTIFDNLFKVLNQNEIIPENADLNTYLTPGAYTCKSSIIAKTILNSPHVTSNFKLIVNNNAGNITSTFNGYQMIVASVGATNPTFHIYYRGVVVTDMTNITDNCFSPWEKLVTDKNEKYKIKDYNNDLKVNNTITKLEDLLKLVPKGETWHIPDFNIDQTVTDFGFPEGMRTWGSMTITNSTSNGHYLIELQTNNNYQFYKRWIGETKNGAAGSNQAYQVNWKNICTTGVPDVDKTFVPFTVPSTITVYNADRPDLFGLYYIVKNGICYVDVTMSLASISQMANFTVLCSGIPKPAMSYVRNEINSWNDKTAPTLCMAINGGESTFLLAARNMSTSPMTPSNSDGHFGYFCSFSYPVSES